LQKLIGPTSAPPRRRFIRLLSTSGAKWYFHGIFQITGKPRPRQPAGSASATDAARAAAIRHRFRPQIQVVLNWFGGREAARAGAIRYIGRTLRQGHVVLVPRNNPCLARRKPKGRVYAEIETCAAVVLLICICGEYVSSDPCSHRFRPGCNADFAAETAVGVLTGPRSRLPEVECGSTAKARLSAAAAWCPAAVITAFSITGSRGTRMACKCLPPVRSPGTDQHHQAVDRPGGRMAGLARQRSGAPAVESESRLPWCRCYTRRSARVHEGRCGKIRSF